MKNNSLATVLTWVLATSVLFGVFFSAQFYFRTKQLRNRNALLQQEVARYQNYLNSFKSLVSDVAEYGKTHPAVDPLLSSIGIRINRSSAPAAKP
jgi:hypothetical protein